MLKIVSFIVGGNRVGYRYSLNVVPIVLAEYRAVNLVVVKNLP